MTSAMLLRCPSCDADNRVPAARLKERSRCGRCKAQLTPREAPLTIHAEAELDELVTHSPSPVIVDFWARWCPPCRAVAPELETLARTRSSSVVVAKVDTDALPALAERFVIRSIPTLILFSGGRERHRITGAMPADAIAQNLQL